MADYHGMNEGMGLLHMPRAGMYIDIGSIVRSERLHSALPRCDSSPVYRASLMRITERYIATCLTRSMRR